MSRSCQEHRLASQAGAHISWAATIDRSARTAPARAALMDRFERQVDPDGVLDPAERARRAEHARQAHMKRMALASVPSRRKAKEARRRAVELDAAADAADAELGAGGGSVA